MATLPARNKEKGGGMRNFLVGFMVMGVALLTGCGPDEQKLDEKTSNKFMVEYLHDVQCTEMTADQIVEKYAALESDKDPLLTFYRQERSGVVAVMFTEIYCPAWSLDKQLANSHMVADGDGFREEFKYNGTTHRRPERVIMKDGVLKITFD